jgi:hypothetical protein
MHFQSIADAIPPVALQIGGLPTILIVFVCLTLIEAYVLNQREWGTFKEIATTTLATNAISTVAVFLLLFVVYDVWEGFVLAFLISVLIEGVVLYFFRRGEWREIIFTTLATNAASYVMLGSFMAIAIKS